MAEVVVEEFATGVSLQPVPLFTQSGDERYHSVDRMILKRADVLPHGLMNSEEVVGHDGLKFVEYVAWVTQRVAALSPDEDYVPRLHFDTYGMLGVACGQRLDDVVSLLGRVRAAASTLQIRIEHPVDGGSRDHHIELMADLKVRLGRSGIDVGIVADEWCNTLEDMRHFVAANAVDMIHVKVPDVGPLHQSIAAMSLLRDSGVGAYFGGSCTETDISARVSAHVAMACGADQALAKPGMGVDEGLAIMRNEMRRTTVLASTR
jgi:methylaspartate ammonia-lyase